MPTDAVQQSLWAEYNNTAKPKVKKKDDDLLPKAIDEVRAEGRASVSLLQRRLRIGYARAARLIDEMENQGIIGPEEGRGRARPILIPATETEDKADPAAPEE